MRRQRVLNTGLRLVSWDLERLRCAVENSTIKVEVDCYIPLSRYIERDVTLYVHMQRMLQHITHSAQLYLNTAVSRIDHSECTQEIVSRETLLQRRACLLSEHRKSVPRETALTLILSASYFSLNFCYARVITGAHMQVCPGLAGSRESNTVINIREFIFPK